MGERARKLLEEALQLPLDERAELAADLMDSIDGEPDEEAEAAWRAEIERRARRAVSGQSTGTDWKTVRSRIEDDLRRR